MIAGCGNVHGPIADARRRASGRVAGLVVALAAIMLPIGVSANPTTDETGRKLQSLLVDHLHANPKIAGEALTVSTPRGTWSVASGKVAGTNAVLTDRHVFRIASATKPFVAAAVLRLMETGKVDVTLPIASYISPESAAVLRAGHYDPGVITVRQLLSHTSGLYDYATDRKFVAAVRADPSKTWTRAEQVQFAINHGKPYGPPGTTYGYSDTGYILLGEIVERQTGQRLGAAVRALLDFQRLGLVDTYWEVEEAPPSQTPFAGPQADTVDMTHANPSFDLYGGGGLISSTADLARFFRALGRGEVFSDRRTLAVLLAIPDVNRPARDGDRLEGNGLINLTIGRANCIGHRGFWGQLIAYCPEVDTSIAWTRNNSIEPSPRLRFRDALAGMLGLN